MAQEHTGDSTEMHWTPLDVTEISDVSNEIRTAQRVVSANMRRITIDDMNEAKHIVTIVGNIVQLIHTMVMSCSMYNADSALEYAAMAIVTDEIQCALWAFHQGLLDHRLRLLDLRRKYTRDRERTGVTLSGVESGFMLAMYIASYETMILSTCDTIKAASQWHHHMSMMADCINNAASHDAAADLENTNLDDPSDVDGSEPITTEIEERGGLNPINEAASLSDSSLCDSPASIEHICEIVSNPKSPIDV
uniref:Uncharacterized protein n=1 Tax=viral metagenome TaxID=1070528 RepID=A0A2V0R9X4_9ZZZZ